MKFIPKKVYIKGNNDYIEMEYDEFLKAYPEYTENRTHRLRSNSDERFFIPIQGCLLEVKKETYREYYKEKERYKYIRSLDNKNRLLSASAISDSLNQEDFADVEAGPEYDVETTTITRIMVEVLKVVMHFLSEDELTMIDLVYDKCLPYGEAAEEMGIPKSTFENRLLELLERLKILMDI